MPVDGRPLDALTKAGLVAAVLAVPTLLIPPIGVACTLVAIACSGAAVYQARRAGVRNRVALLSLAVSAGLVVLVLIGSAIYAAGN